MSIDNTDYPLLKSFTKQCKRLLANFNEESLSQLIPLLENTLLNKNKQIDINKFSPNNKYYDLLFIYNIINAIKQTNQIFNMCMLQTTQKRTYKKKVKIPNNWKIIKGGKK